MQPSHIRLRWQIDLIGTITSCMQKREATQFKTIAGPFSGGEDGPARSDLSSQEAMQLHSAVKEVFNELSKVILTTNLCQPVFCWGWAQEGKKSDTIMIVFKKQKRMSEGK